jgi:putative transposase
MGYNTRAKTVSEKIISHTSSLNETCKKYNEVVTYFLQVIFQEFELDNDYSLNEAQGIVERLVNRTAKNPNPKYFDYNELFPKFPSYFRRAAINSTYGKWSSWRSNYLNWEKERSEAIAIDNKKKFTKKAPTPQFKHNDFPVFYKGNMFNQTSDGYAIKVYKNNDWIWEKVVVRAKTDLTRRGITDWKQCNPKLVKRGKKYFLSFAYEKEVKLHKLKEKDTRILAIDLGLTNSAVGCVMDSDGTVLARLFIKQAKEKDLCEFPEGKQYHADLNASYNIGARFFIRAAIKPLSEKRRLALGAKVPEVLVKTEQTLSTLHQLRTCVA